MLKIMLSMTRPMGRTKRHHHRGTAMVEFAIVAPLLITLLLGIGDIATTTIAKFKSTNATQSAADLATQSINLQTSDMVNIFAAAADVMAPFSSATLVLRITSVAADGNGNSFVHWSCGQGALPPYTAKSAVTTLFSGDSVSKILYATNATVGGYTYQGQNASFIEVESQYTYTAPAKLIIKTAQVMSSFFYTYPRQAAYVGFPWNGNATNQPTAPAATTSIGSTTLSNGATCNYAY